MERINPFFMLSHSLGKCYLTTILIVALLCFIHHSCTYRHAALGTLSFRQRGTFVYSLSFVATSGCPSRVPIFYRSSPFVFATIISARPVFWNLCCGRLRSFRLNGYLRHSRLRCSSPQFSHFHFKLTSSAISSSS